MEFTRYLMAASSRTFLMGLDRSTMVFDKRPTPMILETMHTFAFTAADVEHLLSGTSPSPAPEYWEYRVEYLLEKIEDRAQYGGEGIVVEFRAGDFQVPGLEYEYWDATPLMYAFAPGVGHVSNVYRMTNPKPLALTAVSVDEIVP